MRSVLVCVRTTLAAQAITNAATQLGLADVITTAVSGADALARVAHAPADIVLVDTASVRPDTVGFTRRVLAQTPDAAVVFFGPEESTVARGAVEAGARGLIRGGDREDLVASVAKALMLLLRSRTVSPPSNGAAAVPTSPVGEAEDDASVALGGSGPQPVPLQRSEVGEEDGDDPDATDLGGDGLVAVPRPEANGAANGGTAAAPGSVGVSGPRRLALTERELQVLRGMADGKSNAEIGRELFVSEDTVKTHARRLFRKLGARDRAHAVAAAFRAGLVR